MLAAVEAWVKRDHAAEWKTWLGWLDTISKRVAAIDGVKTAVREPTDLSNKSPSLAITWDAASLNVTGEDVAEELATTKPRIAVGAGTGGGRAAQAAAPGTTGITITAWQMQPGDDKIAAERVHAVLSFKRPPRTTAMPPPAADVSGRWDVDVEFFSSRSQHTLQIEQDGNWIQGSHRGDFSTRELVGMIEGDTVTLRSVDQPPGNSITFVFAGTLANGTISGPIHLGEYLTAGSRPGATRTRRPAHASVSRAGRRWRHESRSRYGATAFAWLAEPKLTLRRSARQQRLDWSPPFARLRRTTFAWLANQSSRTR